MADEEATMPLAFEESEEQTAARLAAEEHDKLMAQRAREAEARAAHEREAEVRRLAEALDTVDRADGALLTQAKAWRAVRTTPLTDQRVTQPSLGGLLPSQMKQIAREQASAAMAWETELASRERWAANQADVAEKLVAGQSPANQEAIRRTIRAAAGLNK